MMPFSSCCGMGAPGPDKGKGKYLLVPPDYKDEIPKGILAKTTSYINFNLRGF